VEERGRRGEWGKRRGDVMTEGLRDEETK